ncbi:hypothetical protein [Sphingomonas sp. IW22]|uniref:hypothetical protein n=1 Tax=Sphingomonas sp. IW22 TaxID=3242489 RepID=UPI003520F912
MLNVVFFFILLAGSCGYALFAGGTPERVAAILILAASIIDFALVSMNARPLADREVTVLLFDIALTIGMIVLALKAERWWPMVVAGVLIVGVEMQLGVWLAPVHHRQVYKIAHAFSAYPVLLMLMIGTWRHRRRARRGPDRAWTRYH